MSQAETATAAPAPNKARPPLCRDFDEDCDDIADKVRCYLYDPAKGRCPFLEAKNGAA